MDQTDNPDQAAATALRLIGPDPQNWVPDRPGVDHNVVLVGGGQTGSALAFALRRAGVGKVSVIDAAEDEMRAGIWLTAARMNLLRTPKILPGPELGIPALGFQAWYEARHGQAAYTAIERIPQSFKHRYRAAWQPPKTKGPGVEKLPAPLPFSLPLLILSRLVEWVGRSARWHRRPFAE